MNSALDAAREVGYCLSLGEWHSNINAVAVPVRTPGGEVISLNCGSPAFVLPAERLVKVVVPRILAAASELARDIGGVAGPALTQLATAAASERKVAKRASLTTTE
jgi:DNA-binding IclR family transcriptional regulator